MIKNNDVENESYVSGDEVLEYLRAYYLSTDPLRIQWEALSTEDRDVYIRRAFRQINELPFTGKPKTPTQIAAFPRDGQFSTSDFLKVKYAQAEQAIALSDAVTAQEIDDRMRLRRAGVVQYSIGDLSETFSNATTTGCSSNFYGLSERAYKYLSKWLRGGYNICTSIKRHCGHL